MKALILAGGRGARLQEVIKDQSKNILEIYGKPLIEYNLDHAIEAGVSEIVIVLHYKAKGIIQKIGREYKGIRIKYVLEQEGRGIVNAMLNAKEALNGSDFFLMLGDEIIPEADIKGMIKKFYEENLFGICGVIPNQNQASIAKTYAMMAGGGGRIFRLIEKPKIAINGLKGTGHCVFKNEILNYVDRTPLNPNRGQKEMVDLFQIAIDDGQAVKMHCISKDYVNVNTREDYELAKKFIKESAPRVLIVHNQMKYFGGAELLIAELCNWLTKRGIKNDILTLSKSKEVEKKLISTRIIIPENSLDISPPGYKSIKDIFGGIKIFRKKLKEIEKNYDVINFHDFPTTWSLWPRKKPAVWFMNMPPNLWSRPDAGWGYRVLNKMRRFIDKLIVNNSIDIIAVIETANLKRTLERYKRKAKLIYFGINYDFFSKGNAKRVIEKYKLKDKFIVIQSGQVSEDKNQLESIKAIEKVKNKIPNVLLILTGKENPDYRKKLENYIKEKKLGKYVFITGFLETREELRDFYKAADVGLFPLGKQGGVLAPFEVICGNTPVIVSEDMETAELFKQHKLGIVTKDYADAILEVYNNQEKYQEQTKKAIRFIKNNLTWKNYAEGMIWAFKHAWNKHKKR